MIKNLLLLLLVLFSGFLGGLVSNCVLVKAQDVQQVVVAKSFELVADNGQVIATLQACSPNLPCLNFYDENKNIRLQMGVATYEAKEGLPFIGIYDQKFQIKELLRLYGQSEAPVLVMKNNGQDRMIMGLDFQNANDPFLVAYKPDNSTQDVIGHYAGK